jgi:hypothetical protein
MRAVAHVPMLAPMTMATAPGSESNPSVARARARPIVAAEECTSALKAAATTTASTALSATDAITWVASGFVLMGAAPSRISMRPRNISPKPRSAAPMSFTTRRLARNVTVKPMPTSSGE